MTEQLSPVIVNTSPSVPRTSSHAPSAGTSSSPSRASRSKTTSRTHSRAISPSRLREAMHMGRRLNDSSISTPRSTLTDEDLDILDLSDENDIDQDTWCAINSFQDNLNISSVLIR